MSECGLSSPEFTPSYIDNIIKHLFVCIKYIRGNMSGGGELNGVKWRCGWP